jgi:hypothetical protein
MRALGPVVKDASLPLFATGRDRAWMAAFLFRLLLRRQHMGHATIGA